MVGRTIPSHNNKETNAGAWTVHPFVTRSKTKRFVTIHFLVRVNLLGSGIPSGSPIHRHIDLMPFDGDIDSPLGSRNYHSYRHSGTYLAPMPH